MGFTFWVSCAILAQEAGCRMSGMPAEDCWQKPMVEPNADVIEGLGANIMPGTYGSQLSEQQMRDVVAYVLTLK
jgi:mono/diheme cytochrome c family protein